MSDEPKPGQVDYDSKAAIKRRKAKMKRQLDALDAGWNKGRNAAHPDRKKVTPVERGD